MADTFLIKKIGITEKASIMQEGGKYMFHVKLSATKPEIKKVIEELYGVKVAGVNALRSFAKAKRFGSVYGNKPEYKKVYVTLKKGQKIDVLGTK